MSNRKKDSNVEREIASYLDEHLYQNKEIFKEYARTDGIDEQISGSDVILSTSDSLLYRVVVDEKVAARYANVGLDTFSLELSFINRNGDKTCGWFLDYSKQTQYYLLGWINKVDIPFNEEMKRYETDLITKDKIRELEWALVSRQKIQKFLEGKGWTLDKLVRQDERIRQNGGVKTKEFINGVSFRYSDSYSEKPINILLKKEDYIKISDYHGVIKTPLKEDKKIEETDGKIILKSIIVNDNFTQYLYDNYDIQNKDLTTTEVPIPSREEMDEISKGEWNIMLICGKSGSGKSTILRNLFGDATKISYDYSKSVISQFEDLTEEEACDLLCSVGLSSVPTWLRKPQELSNGERARLDIAKAIYNAKDGMIVLDEYTSVVNRAAAKSMSFALQRYARQKNLKVVIASCHFDIIEWLQPDYIFNLEHRDENNVVELEKMVYSDDIDYNEYQSVRECEILSEARKL